MNKACALLVALALAVPGAARAEPPVPLLWKVSDADNALYLLGSFHLLQASDYPLAAAVDAAFKDAESVLFEISPAEMASPALAASMMQAGMRDGGTLDAQLGPELSAKLHAWANAQPAGMPISVEVLQRFEPWFAGITVSMVQMTAIGLDPALGLDRHFMERAAKAGKPVAGLETGAQQVALFDTMSEAEQIQMLEDALDDAAAGDGEIARLHAAWRAGRANELWEGMAAEMRAEYPALYQRINVDRNNAWIPQLAERLEAEGSDDTLVVVGALHLLGEHGVVEGLRARGYNVERML